MKLMIDSSDVIETMVLENRLDFALIEGNIHSNKIVKIKFLDDELLPICGRFHSFANRGEAITNTASIAFKQLCIIILF
mgnify:CR=1 FL=1